MKATLGDKDGREFLPFGKFQSKGIHPYTNNVHVCVYRVFKTKIIEKLNKLVVQTAVCIKYIKRTILRTEFF